MPQLTLPNYPVSVAVNLAISRLSVTVSPAFFNAAAVVSARITLSVTVSSERLTSDVSSVYKETTLGVLGLA